MARHNILGKWGEEVALETLISKGYAIRETNWRLHHYEIDIVAMHKNRIVFAEVKTRSTDESEALRAIDKRRINRMVTAANFYVRHYDLPHEVQYDVITVIGNPNSFTVNHIADAFTAPLRSFR